MNGLLIQVIDQEIFKEQGILWSICLIAKHCFYFLSRAMVVSLMVSLECSFEHILADINRLVPSVCTGHFGYRQRYLQMKSMFPKYCSGYLCPQLLLRYQCVHLIVI